MSQQPSNNAGTSSVPATLPSTATTSQTATSNPRPSNNRSRHRDERDFSDPDVLRGLFQSLEAQQAISDQRQSALANSLSRIEALLVAAARPPSRANSEASQGPSIPPLVVSVEQDDGDLNSETSGTAPKLGRPTTRLTEKIEPLDDGLSPSFKQWRASIQDRLEVNADHYPTERSRRALIWGATTGVARNYLEP